MQTRYGTETQIEYSFNFSPTPFFLNGSVFEISLAISLYYNIVAFLSSRKDIKRM